MVLALYDKDPEIQLNSFNLIKSQITTSTSSMTSIPKPLKFLRNHYEELKEFYIKNYENTTKDFKFPLSDLLACIVMVVSATEDTVLFWVVKGNKKNLTQWGLEFVRTLCGNIAEEINKRVDAELPFEDLYEFVAIIIPYLIDMHSESEAVDLLLEVEKLETIMDFVNTNNYKRICLYLMCTPCMM